MRPGDQVEKLTAEMFRTMAHAAAVRLEAEKARVDALNVFPVPDGDTGTNMALTLWAATEAVLESESDSLGELAESAAHGALMGARGNSGVILSQFLRGFADGIGSHTTATPTELAQSFATAAEAAYGAVMRPVEGTVLTVGREAANEAVRIAETGGDLQAVLEGALRAATETLADTPNLLAALREAGVVDAGGEGLVVAARGAYEVLNGKAPAMSSPVTTPARPTDTVQGEQLTEDASDSPDDEITYRYCTELVVRGDGIDRRSIKRDLSDLGDSLLVVGQDELVKVHIHTNHPGLVLELCGVRGQLLNIHIDNMEEQSRLAAEKLVPTGMDRVTDAQARVPVEIAVVTVASGTGCIELLKSLGATAVVEGGQTMNPSTQEILTAIQNSRAKEALVLPNNKNVLMSARQAAHLASIPVTVVPTRSFCQGVAALLRFSPDASVAENAKQMEAAIGGTACGEITVAVRDARVESMDVRAGDYLGISDGKILVAAVERQEVVQQLIASLMMEDSSLATLYYGEDVEAEEADHIAQLVRDSLNLDVEVYRGGQPVYAYLLSVE